MLFTIRLKTFGFRVLHTMILTAELPPIALSKPTFLFCNSYSNAILRVVLEFAYRMLETFWMVYRIAFCMLWIYLPK